MTDYDDETLGAYVDGELPAAKAAALKADICGNAALRQRIAELHHINLALRASYTELAPPLMAPWRLTAHAEQPLTQGNSVRSRVASWRYPALAAGIALLVGIGLGQFIHISGTSPSAMTDVAVHRLLQDALDHTLSGQSVSWTDQATHQTTTVEPLRTYYVDRTFCREYRQISGAPRQDDKAMYGVACRTTEGTWNVEFTLVSGDHPLLVRR
jgi:anti-sigma-K factor RskA